MISLFLFAAIFRTRGVIAGMTFSDVMLYFLIVQIITTFLFTRSGFIVCNDIKQGNYANYLTRPLSYIGYTTITEICKNFVRSWFGIVIFGIGALIINPQFIMRIPLQQALVGGVSIILAFLILTWIGSMIGLMSFWIIDSHRFVYMYFGIMSIFSGQLVPLAFFPAGLRAFVEWTPFPYMINYPAQLLIAPQPVATQLHIIGVQLAWVIGEYLILRLMVTRGTKRFESIGG